MLNLCVELSGISRVRGRVRGRVNKWVRERSAQRSSKTKPLQLLLEFHSHLLDLRNSNC